MIKYKILKNGGSFNMLKCVITGGPGAGKTEIMSHLTQILEDRGYKIFVVPESPR